MAWSTTIVAPPDGSMAAYMASVETLRGMEHALYRPGHGGPVTEPQRFLRGLVQHRRQREAAILGRLRAGDERIAEMVPPIYQGLPPALHGAAALSVLAQLEDLVLAGSSSATRRCRGSAAATVRPELQRASTSSRPPRRRRRCAPR